MVRKLYLPLAAILGAAAAVLPGLAVGSPPTTASFKAIDYAWQADGGLGSQTTIATGGTVTFSYPSGASAHNADFGSGAQPTSCTQTAGASSGAVPPLPHQASSPGWSGTCSFSTAGTYTFHCDLHPFMTGTIVVQAPGTTTATTTTPPTTSATTSSTTTASTPASTTPTTTTSTTPGTTTTSSTAPGATTTLATAPSPPTGTGASSISIAARQHGTAVQASVKILAGGAGGRLEVELFATARSLGAGRTGLVRVGRLVRGPLAAGTVRFAIQLNATAKRALRRRGQLQLTVKLAVRSPRATPLSATRIVLLRA